MVVFEDKLNFSKMEVIDGAVVQPGVFSEIAKYKVPTGEIARFWGFTRPVTATQSIIGSFKALLQDATPAAISDDAVIRLVVANASQSRKIEIWRGNYGDIKNGVQLPVHKPGAQPYSYLIIEAKLPDDATASFTFSKTNSSVDVSTTVIEE